jgi:hypothetical protein
MAGEKTGVSPLRVHGETVAASVEMTVLLVWAREAAIIAKTTAESSRTQREKFQRTLADILSTKFRVHSRSFKRPRRQRRALSDCGIGSEPIAERNEV